jgi:two-component system, LytTR family, sensor kinase
LIRLIDNARFRIIVIVVFWTLWVLFRIGQVQTSAPANYDWGDIVLRPFIVGFGWAVTTPVILWVTTRLRQFSNFGLILLFHLLSASFVLFFRVFLFAVMTVAIYGEAAHPQYRNDISQMMISLPPQWGYGAFLLYGFIAAVYSALLWFKDNKESEQERSNLKLKFEILERQLSDAKLTALRMQLNPHFLFNTLHSVATLVRLKEREKAINVLSKLSGMLRYTIYEGTKNMVTAREEIEFIKGYLDIEEIRFQDRLKIDWNIGEESLNTMLPNLLLQPIVENSIKHGLKQADDGVLAIDMKRIKDRIVIQIHDNGIGLPKDWKLENSKGIGLRNTIARLENIFPDNFEFKMSSNGDQRGTVVSITLPFVKQNGNG